MPKQERWEYDADDAQDRHRGIDPLEDNVPARLSDAGLKAAYVSRGLVVLGEKGGGNIRQVEIPVEPAVITTPTALPGCALWLDASQLTAANGTALASWPDLSGRGHNAVQPTAGNQPTVTTGGLNGKRIVTFPGAQYLEINNFGFTPGTVFMVARNDGTNSHRALAGGISGDTNNPVDAWYFKANANATVAAEFSVADSRSGADLTLYTGLPAIIGAPYVQTCTLEPGSKTISLWTNGGRPQRSTARDTPEAILVTPGTKVSIGADYYAHSPGDFLSGYIAEVIFYDRVLSHAELTAVGRYLAAKWGLAVKDFVLPDPITEQLLLSTFQYSSGDVAWQTHLTASTDGVNWRHINDNVPLVCGPPLVSDGGAANGSLFRHIDGFYYLATTSNNDHPWFNIHRSADLFTWEFWAKVDCSGVSGSSRAWAPEFFGDTDGSVHLFLCLSVGGSHQIYETHPTNLAAGLRSWTVPTMVTGTGFPAQMIDPFVVKIAGSYQLWYKNDTTRFTEVYTSNSLLSGYTALHTGNWISNTIPQEGPSLFRANGRWRILFDPGSLQYAESSDLQTWTAAAPLVFTPTPLTPMRHGTVIAR